MKDKRYYEQKHQRHFPDIAQASRWDASHPEGMPSPFRDINYRQEWRELCNDNVQNAKPRP